MKFGSLPRINIRTTMFFKVNANITKCFKKTLLGQIIFVMPFDYGHGLNYGRLNHKTYHFNLILFCKLNFTISTDLILLKWISLCNINFLCLKDYMDYTVVCNELDEVECWTHSDVNCARFILIFTQKNSLRFPGLTF